MNRLKTLRQEKNLTQQEMADIAEVSKRTYIYWESGDSQIKPEKAQKLADYFGVSVGFLLGFGTIEEELAYSRKETIQLFEKENRALLDLGYILSDKDLHTILNLIHTISSTNERYFWKMLEHNDENINFEFEDDYFLFSEKYPNYIKELTQKYRQYEKRINDPAESEKIRGRLKTIEDFQNSEYHD